MTWTIVVTDGDQRSALAVVRSLGRAGHRVYVCSSKAQSLAGASRYCAGQRRLPDALREPSEFAEAVMSWTREISADVLIPITDASLLAVLPRRDCFACAIPFPTIDVFSAVSDKQLVLQSAIASRIAIPRQVAVQENAAEYPEFELSFPVVLKPSRSVSGAAGQRRKLTVLYASDAKSLHDTLNRLPPEAFPVLLQERIDGPGFAISLFMWNGEVRAAFAHRRLREKPPSGGVSVLREAIPLDEDLMGRGVSLLRGLGWTDGVAMVEFKLDRRTGTPYLMEINGRLWGSLQLAIDAGVDFPLLLARAAMGIEDPPQLSYDTTVRTRWELGDLDNLIAILRKSRAALNLPPSAPGRMRAVRDFIAAFSPSIHAEVFRMDDPRPFFREGADWLFVRK